MSNNLFTPEDSERIELLCQLNRLEAPVEKLRELVVYTEKYNRKQKDNPGQIISPHRQTMIMICPSDHENKTP